MEENSKFATRSNEPISSLLAACSSQNSPETDALEAFLDEFQDLGGNTDLGMRYFSGYEPGLVCAKILSVIERKKAFEILFSKLMTVITEISENNSEVWKATARQILNIFINKKFSPGYLKTMLKRYTVVLNNIEAFMLHDFSLENLPLLKTFSLLVQQSGDFETQFAVMRVVFIHFSNDLEPIADFFASSKEEKTLFRSLKFDNFDGDCRLFLNAVNKCRIDDFTSKVFTISGQILYLRDCLVKPLLSDKVIWIDANEETERLGINSENQNLTYVTFREITHVQIKEKTPEKSCHIMIQTKTLGNFNCGRENNIYLATETTEDVYKFVDFLQSKIQKRIRKFSETDSLFPDRNLTRKEKNLAFPKKMIPIEESDEENIISQTQIKTPHLTPQDRKIVLESQNSFSLCAFEDITAESETNQFKNSQKGFFLKIPQENPFCFNFGQKDHLPNKEKTCKIMSKSPENTIFSGRTLKELKQPEATSQDYFRQIVQHKKPSLPKLKRKKIQGKEKKKKRHIHRKYKPSLMEEVVEQPKPSLLDPNGYTCRRWMRPTTSERGNFWVRKLEKQLMEKADVYDFIESDSEENKMSKLMVNRSKRTYSGKLPSLKQEKCPHSHSSAKWHEPVQLESPDAAKTHNYAF